MLSVSAEKILHDKYYLRDRDGNVVENFDSLCARVATAVASTENDSVKYWTRKYYQVMNNLWFLPGGRVLANTGKNHTNNLYNCYGLSINDSRESIYTTLSRTAEIFAHGGGVGINFSSIRECGAPVSNGSCASGPCSFLNVFNASAEVISQASRRGAMLAVLNCDHPDIYDFVSIKNEEGILEHFNLSVGITNEFMNAVHTGSDFYSVSRYSGERKKIDARALFDYIAEYAWRTGDPGFIFLDRLDKDNAAPFMGKLDVCNPCGEVPLRDGACDLGSINLTKMLSKRRDGSVYFDEEKFVYTVSIGIRFLDAVHDVSVAPVSEIDQRVMSLRKIGLGVFGWADTLSILNIPYDSQLALTLASLIGDTMKRTAYETSKLLAEEKGAYPAFDQERSRNIWYPKEPVTPTRNAMLLSLAPTGSLSLLCDVNSGIEPFFALAYTKNVVGAGKETKYKLTSINKYLLDALSDLGDDTKLSTVKHLREHGEIQSLGNIPDNIKHVFRSAHDIKPINRLSMQAAWQGYVDGAISSTINLPSSATIDDVKKIIKAGWKLGLKGMTVFRDRCRDKQILDVGVSTTKCAACKFG